MIPLVTFSKFLNRYHLNIIQRGLEVAVRFLFYFCKPSLLSILSGTMKGKEKVASLGSQLQEGAWIFPGITYDLYTRD